jgi:hypothetical protein
MEGKRRRWGVVVVTVAVAIAIVILSVILSAFVENPGPASVTFSNITVINTSQGDIIIGDAKRGLGEGNPVRSSAVLELWMNTENNTRFLKFQNVIKSVSDNPDLIRPGDKIIAYIGDVVDKGDTVRILILDNELHRSFLGGWFEVQ